MQLKRVKYKKRKYAEKIKKYMKRMNGELPTNRTRGLRISTPEKVPVLLDVLRILLTLIECWKIHLKGKLLNLDVATCV